MRPLRLHWPRIFGYDFFISFKLGPAPIGTQSYCSDLARRLRELDFTVFFSEDEAAPGASLDSTVLRALRRSRILVVVLNDGAILHSAWVRREVEEFRAMHPRRLVIPINIADAIGRLDDVQGVSRWLGHRGQIWLNESEQSVRQGIADSEVLRRLQVSNRHLRVNVLLRWTAGAIVSSLAGLVVWASLEAHNANRRFREATAMRLASEGVAAITGQSAGGVVRGVLQVVAARQLFQAAETDSALQEAHARLEPQVHIREVGSAVTALAFHPDGQSITSASFSGNLQRWDAGSGWPSGPGWIGKGPVAVLAHTGDGRRVVSGTREGSLEIWDNETHQTVADQATFPSPALTWSVSVSADGAKFAWGRENGEYERWDIASGRSLTKQSPLPPSPPPLAMAFSRDGQMLAYYTNAGTVGLLNEGPNGTPKEWQSDTGAGYSVSNPMGGEFSVRAGVLAFTPDGRYVVSGNTVGYLQQWELVTGNATLTSTDGHEGGVTAMAYSADGKSLISVGNDGALRRWDAKTLKLLLRHEAAHTGPITAMAVQPNGSALVTAGLDNTLRIWKGASSPATAPATVSTPFHKVDVVGFDRLGAPIVTGTTFNSNLSASAPAAHSPVAALAVVRGVDRTLTLIDTASAQTVAALTTAAESTNVVWFSPNGAYILGLDHSDRVVLWDGRTGKRLSPVMTGVRSGGVAIDRESRQIATADDTGTIRIWALPAGQRVAGPYHVHGDRIRQMSFSPDGLRMAAVNSDGVVRVFDSKSARLVLPPLKGHKSGAESVAFSPDGAYIASGGGYVDQGLGEQAQLDYTVRLWDARTGRLIGRPIATHDTGVTALAFSPDGRSVLSSTGGGRTLLTTILGGWSKALCDKLPRNPTKLEWAAWVSSDIEYACPCPGLASRPAGDLTEVHSASAADCGP